MDQDQREAIETIIARSESLLRLALANRQFTLVPLLRDVVRTARAEVDRDAEAVRTVYRNVIPYPGRASG